MQRFEPGLCHCSVLRRGGALLPQHHCLGNLQRWNCCRLACPFLSLVSCGSKRPGWIHPWSAALMLRRDVGRLAPPDRPRHTARVTRCCLFSRGTKDQRRLFVKITRVFCFPPSAPSSPAPLSQLATMHDCRCCPKTGIPSLASRLQWPKGRGVP